MKFAPYLAFDGNAQDALSYYCDELGAELVMSMTFGDMPENPDWITDANKDRLAHGTILLNGIEIMASDTPGFEPHGGFSGITLQTEFDTVADGEAFFKTLARDGTVKMPFEKTFWAERFGFVEDKFGVPWMVNVTLHEE